VAGLEVAAEHGDDAEGGEKVIADADTGGGDGAGTRPRDETRAAVEGERGENGVVVFPVEVVLIGKVGAGRIRGALAHVHQLGGALVGKWFDQDRIHEGEDGEKGAGAEGEDSQGGQAERRILGELPGGKAQIAEQVFEHGGPVPEYWRRQEWLQRGGLDAIRSPAPL